MRRALLLLLLVAAPAGALTLPSEGLPAGRLQGQPFLNVAHASGRAWAMTQAFARSLGPALPNASAWAALTEDQGRVVAALIVPRLSSQFWGRAADPRMVDAAGRAEMQAQFLDALQGAAADAELKAHSAVYRFQKAVEKGQAGARDLAALENDLAGLSVYGGDVPLYHEEVRRAGELQRQRAVARVMTPDPFSSEAAPSRDAARPASWSRTATIAGAGLLGAAAVAALPPHASPAVEGALAWSGVALAGLGQFLKTPSTPAALPAAEQGPAATPKALSQLRTFHALWVYAQETLAQHARFDALAGGASWAAFRTWLASGMRAALAWLPISLLGMLAAGMAAKGLSLLHLLSGAPSSHLSPALAAAIRGRSLVELINAHVATAVAAETVLLGGVFAGLRWALAGRLGARATTAAGVLTLAGFAALSALTGAPAGLVLTLLGIQAVLVYVYARSRSLFIPVAMQGLIALASVESTRMVAWLKAGPVAHSGQITDAAVGALAAIAAVMFLASGAYAAKTVSLWKAVKSAAARELERLAEVGRAWSAPAPDGAPKSLLPGVRAGIVWAVPLWLSMYGAYALVHAIAPQAEPSPEFLKRMLAAPVDVIMYTFVIGVALEEWIFRKGLFSAIGRRLRKIFDPSRAYFWPAAILSALIFSGAHYIDFNGVLQKLGVGDPELTKAIAGTYAFTWASFVARAVGGVVMAWLYARSGLLLVPFIAHLFSNSLEGLGVHFGGSPAFIAIGAAYLLLTFRRPH